jgi:hypothetical protein
VGGGDVLVLGLGPKAEPGGLFLALRHVAFSLLGGASAR